MIASAELTSSSMLAVQYFGLRVTESVGKKMSDRVLRCAIYSNIEPGLTRAVVGVVGVEERRARLDFI